MGKGKLKGLSFTLSPSRALKGDRPNCSLLAQMHGKSRKQTRLSPSGSKPPKAFCESPSRLRICGLVDFFLDRSGGNHQQMEHKWQWAIRQSNTNLVWGKVPQGVWTRSSLRSPTQTIQRFHDSIWSGSIPLSDTSFEERVLIKSFTDILIFELGLKNFLADCKN